MIYDCDPVDTISALRAANEDLAAQVKHWKGELEIARKASRLFESTWETLQFQLRAAKSELEITNAEINRLNGMIGKYRAISPSSNGTEYTKTCLDQTYCKYPDCACPVPPQPAPDAMESDIKLIGTALSKGNHPGGVTQAFYRVAQVVRSAAPPVRGDREAIARLVRDYIDSALRWHPVFDDGRGGNSLNQQQTSDLICERLTSALSLPSAPVSERTMVAEIPFDPTNHHNALKCPYCNPDKLEFAAAPVSEREPTPFMRIAGGVAWAKIERTNPETLVDCADACWKAMWDAQHESKT